MEGTPKSLEKAIENGFKQAKQQGFQEETVICEIVRAHVVDFLAQKFGVSMMKYQDQSEKFEELFTRIAGEKK